MPTIAPLTINLSTALPDVGGLGISTKPSAAVVYGPSVTPDIAGDWIVKAVFGAPNT